jgi:hypothetical protein
MKKSLFTLLVMMLFGTAIAQPTSSYFRTQFDMGVYENSYSLIAVIKIDGVIQNNLNLELGAWDETYSTYCGGQLGAYYNAYEQGTIPCYYLAVFGYLGTETNPATGESLAPLGQSVISYRLYDHETEQVLNYECPTKVNWTNTLYGMPSTPVELEFFTPKDMVFEGLEDNLWSNANNWTADGEPAGRLPQAFENASIEAPCLVDMEAVAATVTVTAGNSLTMDEGSLDAELIIEDGAQLFTEEEMTATIQKNINPNDWYLISGPVQNFDYTGFEAANMLVNTYDLYIYDKSYYGPINPDEDPDYYMVNGEWRNYK